MLILRLGKDYKSTLTKKILCNIKNINFWKYVEIQLKKGKKMANGVARQFSYSLIAY